MDLSKPKRKEDRNLLNKCHRMRCAACNSTPCDPAHIRSKGSGGPDEEWNVIPLCRRCHTRQHKQGWVAMSNSYPLLRFVLETNGWELNFVTGKIWNQKLAPKS